MVIIAELDLFDTDGVIFIDDGNSTVFEQSVYGVTYIEVTRTMLEIIRCHQQLRRMVTVLLQAAVVAADQMGLPDGGGGLQVSQIFGAFF